MESTKRTIDRPCTTSPASPAGAASRPAEAEGAAPAAVDYAREADKLRKLMEGGAFGLSGAKNTEVHRRVKRFGKIGLRTHDKATRDSVVRLLTSAASYGPDLSYEGSIRATAAEYLSRLRGEKAPSAPDAAVASMTMYLLPAD